jgi:gamma-glutamyltranspeptidase/glutathione hydrolase
MLNIVEVCAPQLGVDLAKLGHSSPLYWHFLIEAKKIAYADLHRYNADPDFSDVPVQRLISKAYAGTRCKDINLRRAAETPAAADPMGGTVYISAADKDGNMVSLIYSVFEGFGSAITVPGYGFVLNDRANLFSLDPTSPNVIAPGKRPFQTLIPGFVMKDGEPLMSFGLMGGVQQAQGHAQVLINMIDLGANVQAASDAARFSHFQDRNTVWLESEAFRNVGGALSAMGHRVVQRDGTEMGGYQAIMRTLGRTAAQGQIYRGGSDHRKDGQAVGW